MTRKINSLISDGKIIGSILAPSVSKKGDVLSQPKCLEQAFQAGKRLATSIQ